MEELDTKTPGNVYLCQVNESVSCGACCGLYNVADPSFESLQAMLERRTHRYDTTPKTYDALLEFKAIIESEENQNRPYPEFHHCPYIGLIGDNQNRPGCLLHPLGKGNNGTDHRGLSDWGGFACATYFCPTCSSLPENYKRIVRICAGNWYLFGLVVTETEMLKTFFTLVETRHGKPLSPNLFIDNPEAQKQVICFFSLKADWPFRENGYNRYGNYFFNDNLYPRNPLPYQELEYPPSELNAILKALGTTISSTDDLVTAETAINSLIDAIVTALNQCTT